jgi:hypothetical protein
VAIVVSFKLASVHGDRGQFASIYQFTSGVALGARRLVVFINVASHYVSAPHFGDFIVADSVPKIRTIGTEARRDIFAGVHRRANDLVDDSASLSILLLNFPAALAVMNYFCSPRNHFGPLTQPF